jgi:hypothetical protein
MDVCLQEESGGLGVKQLREFNTALLGKWCWRLLVEKIGLWYRVLVARYGEEGGRVADGGRRGSTWWREISQIRDEVSEGVERGWFTDGVARRVGNGLETLFWSDPWLGGIPLAERFPRLFSLSLNKSSMVAAMFDLGWEAVVAASSEGVGGRSVRGV